MFSFSTEQFTEKDQRRIFLRRLFRRAFLEDWSLKLIALGITLALWLGVTGLRAPTPADLKPVPLIMRVSNDMEVISKPQELEISVTGDKRKVDPLLARIMARDLVASIDLTDVKSGESTVILSPETISIDLPSGVKLDRIQPNRILVRVEKVVEREVSVKPEIEGNVAEGFELYSQTVIPARVRVRGAESFVKSLDSISTEKISVANRQEGFTERQVGLNVTNPNVTVLDGIVDVVFRIGEQRIERMIVVPVKTETETRRVSIVLFGARSVLETLVPEELLVELTKSEAGETVPQLILPPDLQDKIEIRKIKLS